MNFIRNVRNLFWDWLKFRAEVLPAAAQLQHCSTVCTYVRIYIYVVQYTYIYTYVLYWYFVTTYAYAFVAWKTYHTYGIMMAFHDDSGHVTLESGSHPPGLGLIPDPHGGKRWPPPAGAANATVAAGTLS